ncbi:MAG TPA: superoxide dismutase [Opitutaceae bacterium]|nr:superoxide dismutase [Opitutaceae bacterium]
MAATAPAATTEFKLPPLGFAYEALEPHIDARTMEIHHTKHHQAYVDNSNKALASYPELLAKGPEEILKNINTVPDSIRTIVRNNVGGHVNHSLFWRILKPSGANGPVGKVAAAIEETFGGFEGMHAELTSAATRHFGSGWGWLSLVNGDLVAHSTANQDSPLMSGATPILGLDVWEHAYYLHYQNRRADYIGAFWKLVNWDVVNELYVEAMEPEEEEKKA